MAEDTSNEVSVANCYSVVYKLENKQWVLTGDGWAQVHIYKDEADGTHRLVGWTVSDMKVVLNANVTAASTYKKKSDDFHKFTSEKDEVFGLGFYNKPESLKEAERFLKVVVEAIGMETHRRAVKVQGSSCGVAHLVGVKLEARERQHRTSIMGVPDPTRFGEAKVMEPGATMKTNVPLGKLKILPKKKPLDLASGPDISSAFSVIHTQSVKYDPKTRRYVGLPPEWEQLVYRQFGIDATKVERVQVAGYKSRIPAVLEQMKIHLIKSGGLKQEGIFRLAPDQDECKFAKQQLNLSTFSGHQDVNVLANLIKVWFRDLPDKLLDNVDAELITACDEENQAEEIIERMEEPNKSLYLWLLDLCCEVSKFSKVNKMGPQNLAIVIGPNLFSAAPGKDPMASLLFSQKVVHFMIKSITWRMKNRG